MKKTLLVGSLLFVAGTSLAQTDKSKKVDTKYLSLPAYDVSQYDLSSLQLNFAMGEGQFGAEKKKETKSKCKPKGGSLKDIVEVTAVHYEIPYNQPASYFIAKSVDGTIVYADKSSEEGAATIRFGYDEKMKQSKCEYWIPETLEKDFAKDGAAFKTKEHEAYRKQIFEKARDKAGVYLTLSYISEQIDVYGAKGKGFDYSDLDKAQESALVAFESINDGGVNAGDFELLSGAIEVWERELESLNTEDKKARINTKIAKGLHENCVYAYSYMFQFDKAKEHANAFQKLFGNFTNNRTQAMDAIIQRLYLQEIAKEKNKTILEDLQALHAKAGVPKTEIQVIRLGSNGLNQLSDDFFEFNKDQAITVHQEQKKEEEEKIASGEVNPYQKYYLTNQAGGEGIIMTMPPSSFSGIPELSEFPIEICEFVNAKQVMILNNKIASIPADITKMKALKKLDLSSNQLTTLPAEIGQLENLQTLKLSKNPIESLPAALGNCKKLKSLVIKGTKLSADQIKELQALLPNCKIKA